MKNKNSKSVMIISIFIVLLTIVMSVLISKNIIHIPGVTDSRQRTIKKYSVKYDQIPKLNKETAEKIVKVRKEKQQAFMILGVVVIVILISSVVFTQIKKKKDDK